MVITKFKVGDRIKYTAQNYTGIIEKIDDYKIYTKWDQRSTVCIDHIDSMCVREFELIHSEWDQEGRMENNLNISWQWGQSYEDGHSYYGLWFDGKFFGMIDLYTLGRKKWKDSGSFGIQ